MPRDPSQQNVTWDFPNLPYAQATASTLRLMDRERLCTAIFVEKLKTFHHVWEYGNYFLDQYIATALVKPDSALCAALLIDAYEALRASLLVAQAGYQPHAMALVRKAHESLIRGAACRMHPKKAFDIVRSSSLQRSEHDLGLNLRHLYDVGGFTHSNRLRAGRTVVAILDGQAPPRVFGPTPDEELMRVLPPLIIFWLHFGISLAPFLISPAPEQEKWLAQRADSKGLLLGYLRDSGNPLEKDCGQVEELCTRFVAQR